MLNFNHVSLVVHVNTGGVWHPPQADTAMGSPPPPLDRHFPSGQTPPPWQTPPLQRPPGRPPLCSACWDTVNKRAVRILPECILVPFIFTIFSSFLLFSGNKVCSVD